ncbi:hypothetical protein [Salmonella enterica]|uniref:hypothetical protein n=1 Tax=Salmonella enterica TaxID=28901 RepID=UPI0035254029
MKNKNQTSIEWFVEQLPTRIINKYLIEIEIAKGKNEEEIKEAYREGITDQNSGIDKWYSRNAQYYFNQTYKNE